MQQRPPRKRVTVTLARDLLERVDQAASVEPTASRSAIIERWLRRGLVRDDEAEIARETIAYYQSLSDQERVEDAAMSVALSGAARRTLAESPARPKRRSGARRSS